MSEIECSRCHSPAVPVGHHPQHGVINQCMHNPDHVFAQINPDHRIYFEVNRPGSAGPECSVFRCMAPPDGETFVIDSSGLVMEMPVCRAHSAALRAGESYMGGPNDKLLMGEDYRIAMEE